MTRQKKRKSSSKYALLGANRIAVKQKIYHFGTEHEITYVKINLLSSTSNGATLSLHSPRRLGSFNLVFSSFAQSAISSLSISTGWTCRYLKEVI